MVDDSGDGFDFDSIRGDLFVAVIAAAAAVSLTAANQLLLEELFGIVPLTAPIVVYFAYLFTRKGGPYAALDTPRNWAGLAVLVAVIVFVYGIA